MNTKAPIGFFDGQHGKKFWVLVYVVPWFIIGFFTAMFLRNSANQNIINNRGGIVNASFTWEKLPWKLNNDLQMDSLPVYTISMYGVLSKNSKSKYSSLPMIETPPYISVSTSSISLSGHSIHSGVPFPSSHPWFPRFDIKNFSSTPNSQVLFPRLVALPKPPGMSDYLYFTTIFPLLFSIPREIVSSSRMVVGSISEPFYAFLERSSFNREILLINNGKNLITEEIIVPRYPDHLVLPQANYVAFRTTIFTNMNSGQRIRVLILRDGDSSLRRREQIIEKLQSLSPEFILLDKRWTLTEQIRAFMSSDYVISFSGESLNLALFMKSATTLIEIQKEDVISRPALIAHSLGIRVHIIGIKEGDVINDDIIQVIMAIIEKKNRTLE